MMLTKFSERSGRTKPMSLRPVWSYQTTLQWNRSSNHWNNDHPHIFETLRVSARFSLGSLSTFLRQRVGALPALVPILVVPRISLVNCTER